MVLKLPPPPQFTGPQWQQLNRWFLEFQNILNNQGTIDQSDVDGLPTVVTQVGTNTTSITTINGEITVINGEITTINGQITTINGEITTINSEIAALALIRNGSGAPGAGLGNNGDLYLNNTGGAGTRLYGKIAGSWTAIA
jgi:hypothetical protein